MKDLVRVLKNLNATLQMLVEVLAELKDRL
mgnify:CR=1 FL=1